jgi:hypothetical protein
MTAAKAEQLIDSRPGVPSGRKTHNLTKGAYLDVPTHADDTILATLAFNLRQVRSLLGCCLFSGNAGSRFAY